MNHTNVKKTHMKAMESCLRSFSKFFMFASDCAQKMMAIHEHTLYCKTTQQSQLHNGTNTNQNQIG